MMKRRHIIILLIILLAFVSGCSKDKGTTQGSEDLMESDDIQTDDIEEDTDDSVQEEEIEELDYVLYIRHRSVPVIYGERYSISSDDSKLKDKTIEEVALDHLIAFNDVEDLVSPIPKDTRILGLTKEQGTVTVDLSREFIDNMWQGTEYAKMAIISIVDTVTFFEDNERVLITVEGQDIKTLNGIEMTKAFEFSSEFFPDK